MREKMYFCKSTQLCLKRHIFQLLLTNPFFFRSEHCHFVLDVLVPSLLLDQQDLLNQVGLSFPCLPCPPDEITQWNFIEKCVFNGKKVDFLPSLQVNLDQEPRQVPLALVSQHLPATSAQNYEGYEEISAMMRSLAIWHLSLTSVSVVSQ